MSTTSAIAELEKRIDHYYEAHSAKRVAMAALLVGVVSIGLCWAAYYFTVNVFVATGVFAVGSLLAINVVMYAIVPPMKQLADSKKRMLGALKNPIRIKSVNGNKVALADSSGKVGGLSRLEQKVWDSIVISYFIKMSARGGAGSTRSANVALSSTETKVMAKRQAELIAHKKELLAERNKMDEERAGLDARAKELKKMQDKLEDRMSRVEASKEDLVRLKVNLQRRIEESENAEVDSAEHTILEEKAAELKAKELALESAKQKLADDRDRLDAKKTQLEGVDAALQGSTPVNDSTDSKAEEQEAREKDIEERLRYVASVEDDLIARLNQLSEREASVEQTEVEAGIRED